jgi:hypothetical protein
MKEWRKNHSNYNESQEKKRSESKVHAIKDYKRWTSEDKQIVSVNSGGLTDEQLGRKLGRTIQAIQHARAKLKKEEGIIG